jgi:hypothetical protein
MPRRSLPHGSDPLPLGETLDMELKKVHVNMPPPPQMNAEPVYNLLVWKPRSRERVRGRKLAT